MSAIASRVTDAVTNAVTNAITNVGASLVSTLAPQALTGLASRWSESDGRGPAKAALDVYASLRSAVYQMEGLLGPAIELAILRRRPRLPTDDPELFRAARGALIELLQRDVERIVSGVIPIETLKPESPLRHLSRIPTMLLEGVAISRRRGSRQFHRFSNDAQELLTGLPEYYQRNFHFQGDGYLSERSAELYEHQVEVLFAGAADAMRRLILPPLRDRFAGSDGEGLSFLELGAGTGRATRFVRSAFPKAKIVALDLSAPYLKKAQRALAEFPRHDFVEGDAANLPFKSGAFDAVYSVFLFHELPMKERRAVVREAARVLKPGGFHGLVDSLQRGDVPSLDTALEQFPVQFHEPFYKNYTLHPMDELLRDGGVTDVRAETGFFSKALWGVQGE